MKPTKAGTPGGGIRPLPGGQTYVATDVPLRLMMKRMDKITDSQIVGGPSRMDNDRGDVEGKAEKPSKLDQLHAMFQTLLADRFQLKFHKESRELSALGLTVDQGGPKLKPSESQEWTAIPITPAGPGKIVAPPAPIPYFCWFISQQANVPVVDKTGLTGFYDGTLELPPPEPPPAGANEPRGVVEADRMADAFAHCGNSSAGNWNRAKRR